MSPSPPSAKLSHRQSLNDTADTKMAGMLFTSIYFFWKSYNILLRMKQKSTYNGVRNKGLSVVSMLDYCSISMLIEIQDVCIKAVMRDWQIPFCPSGNVIFLLNVLFW